MNIAGKMALLGVLALTLLHAGPARAADPAEQLLEAAVKRYGLADFEGSLDRLSRAQQATGDPALLGLIHMYQGLNYGELDRLPLARAAFATGLSHDPDACPDPARFKARLVQLCQKVRQGLRGTIAVGGEQTGAEVSVDGKPAGTAPLELRVTIGSHLVLVQGPSGPAARHRLRVLPDRTTRVSSAPGSSATELQPEREGEPSAQEPTSPRRRRLWTWIAAGAAAACLVAGGAVWGVAESEYGEWEDLADREQTTADEERRLGELEDGIKTKEKAAWALFGMAGALAVTSAVLFFVEGRAGSEERRSSARVMPVIGPRGAGLRVSF